MDIVNNFADYLSHFRNENQNKNVLKKDLDRRLSEKQYQVQLKDDEIKTHETKLVKVKGDYADFKSEHQHLQSRLNEVQKTRAHLMFEIKVKKPKISMSRERKQTLETWHEQLRLYKHLSGVRWNYSLISKAVRGAISNNKDYLSEFNYPLETEDITEKLWQKINKSIEHHIPKE